MNRRILLAWLVLVFITVVISSCTGRSTNVENYTKSLQLALNDYFMKQEQLNQHKVLDLRISPISQGSNGTDVMAIFDIQEKFRLNYAKAEDVPVLKGKLNGLRDYAKQLSAVQLKMVNEDIEAWRHDLTEYITTDQQGFDRIKVVGKLDSSGKLLPGSVKFYHEGDGPDGKGIVYGPCNLKDIPTPQEVERDSYNAIRDKAGVASN